MLTLKIADLSQQYKSDSWILDNLSVTLNSGLSVLIGPNGAGKTTFLRLLAGVLQPSAGKILFDGKDISHDYNHYKQRIGYLPQEFGFYPDMTGRTFLNYMARLKGLPPELYPERVEEMAEHVGIKFIWDRTIDSWSSGLKRRLGLAQALLNDPDILILDEPMVGLDPEEKLFYWNYLYKLSRDRIVILSSNTLADFITLADGVVLLVNGKVRFHGQVQEFTELVNDKVWTVEIPLEQGKMFAEKWAISAISFSENGYYIRIVSDTIPDFPGVCPAEPCIEDAYTHLVRQKYTSSKE